MAQQMHHKMFMSDLKGIKETIERIAKHNSDGNTAVRRLGRWWKRLHRAGIWYVFLIFLAAYGGRVVEGPVEAVAGAVPPGSYGAHVVVTIALLGGVLLRVAARYRPRPQAAPRHR